MITTRGAGFLALAIALFFLARLTQVGWLYLLDSILWGALILSAILPWLATLFLSAQRSLKTPTSTSADPYPSEGGKIEIQVDLRNQMFWPRFLLNLEYWCHPAEPGRQRIRLFVAKLNGSHREELTSTVDLHQRGNHLLGPVFIESAAPFGLVRRRRKLTSAEPLLVYPKVHKLARLPLADALSEAAGHSRQSRQGLDPAGARKYVSGDPRRNIHWRNTARAGQPMVKEFDDPSQSALHLVFDATQVLGEGSETTLEYAIKIVASAAFYAHRIPVRVQLSGGGIHGQLNGADGGGLTWPGMLRQLAYVGPGDGPDLAKTLAELPPGSNVLVATDLSGAAVMQSLTRAIPFHQRMVVISLEGFGGEESQSNGSLSPDGQLDALESAGAVVVQCRRGQLTQALDALGRVGATGSAPSRYAQRIESDTASKPVAETAAD